MICPICCSSVSIYCDDKKIYRCIKCGLGITQGIVRQVSSYHRDNQYMDNNEQFRNIFQYRIDLITKYKKHGRVLEIGSSTGLMLYLLKNLGWEVTGIEPSEKAANHSINLGIKTIKKSIDQTRLPMKSFDVVILNHTLEHLDNPVKTLSNVYKILKKDGLLLVSVPNFSSLSSKILGCHWYFLLPLEHKWHFSQRSLISLLNLTGFKAKECRTASGVFDYADPVLELRQAALGLKKRFFREIFTLIPDFLISQLNLGSGQTILAIKP